METGDKKLDQMNADVAEAREVFKQHPTPEAEAALHRAEQAKAAYLQEFTDRARAEYINRLRKSFI